MRLRDRAPPATVRRCDEPSRVRPRTDTDEASNPHSGQGRSRTHVQSLVSRSIDIDREPTQQATNRRQSASRRAFTTVQSRSPKPSSAAAASRVIGDAEHRHREVGRHRHGVAEIFERPRQGEVRPRRELLIGGPRHLRDWSTEALDERLTGLGGVESGGASHRHRLAEADEVNRLQGVEHELELRPAPDRPEVAHPRRDRRRGRRRSPPSRPDRRQRAGSACHPRRRHGRP